MTKSDRQTVLENALLLAQNNNTEAAIVLFEQILSNEPNQPDALHGLGMAYAQQHDFNKAVSYMQQAINVAPKIAEFHNNLGNAYKALGKTNEAMRHYQEALKLKSPYPQAHNNLGSLLYRIGRVDEAIDHFQKSLRMAPDSVDTHFNLAISLVKQDKLVEATTHFQEVLKRRPDHLSAMHNLGIALCVLKQFSEAEPLLLNAVKREPNNVDALFHLGIVEGGLGKLDEAEKHYKQILTLDPNHGGTHHNLATLYLHRNEPKTALTHYQQAFRLDVNNQTAKHMIASLSGQTLSEGAPLEYTRALFDQYAYNYDQHVKSHLRYQVPTLLREALTPYAMSIKEPWKALDLGCGTGLCAPLFTDIVGHLTGIDVSENMIMVAKQQGGYHKLIATDIISFLEYKFNEYDLMISADVLVYFGDLKTLFKLTHQALKPQGYFCFSIETLTAEESEKNAEFPDFQLRPTGRYAHRAHYIETLAKESGYTLLSQTEATLRYQEEIPVLGKIFVLTKSK